MLSDDERRSLDATAALLARDDPRLAAQLGQHRLTPPRHHPGRGRSAPPPALAWWRRPAVWPPLLLFVLCLTVLFLPALLAG